MIQIILLRAAQWIIEKKSTAHKIPPAFPEIPLSREREQTLRLPRAKHDPQPNLFWAGMNVSVKVYRYGWKRKAPRNSGSIWIMLCLAGTPMRLTAKKNRRFSEFALLSRWNNTELFNRRERERHDLWANVLGRAETHLGRSQRSSWKFLRRRKGSGLKLLGTNLLVTPKERSECVKTLISVRRTPKNLLLVIYFTAQEVSQPSYITQPPRTSPKPRDPHTWN